MKIIYCDFEHDDTYCPLDYQPIFVASQCTLQFQKKTMGDFFYDNPDVTYNDGKIVSPSLASQF